MMIDSQLVNNGSFELQQHTQKLSLSFIEARLKHQLDSDVVSELADDWLTNDSNSIAISHSCQYLAILKNNFLFIVNNTNHERQVVISVQNACTLDGWVHLQSDMYSILIYNIGYSVKE
jgi:hypothetical protein